MERPLCTEPQGQYQVLAVRLWLSGSRTFVIDFTESGENGLVPHGECLEAQQFLSGCARRTAEEKG